MIIFSLNIEYFFILKDNKLSKLNLTNLAFSGFRGR